VKEYYYKLPDEIRPKWNSTYDFATFRIYDNGFNFIADSKLDDLEANLQYLQFFQGRNA
jgi:hypothetical protein